MQFSRNFQKICPCCYNLVISFLEILCNCDFLSPFFKKMDFTFHYETPALNCKKVYVCGKAKMAYKTRHISLSVSQTALLLQDCPYLRHFWYFGCFLITFNGKLPISKNLCIIQFDMENLLKYGHLYSSVISRIDGRSFQALFSSFRIALLIWFDLLWSPNNAFLLY